MFGTSGREAPRFGLWLALLLVAGCAGMEPYEPRDDREEGPERGLFSGSKGEFVIFGSSDEPDTSGEENNTKIEGGDQKP